MKRWSSCAMLWVVLGGAGALSNTAIAAESASAAGRAEASMLVTGSVTLAPDGTVRSYSIYRREALPKPVAELIDKNAPAWRFERVRVQGQAVAAVANMSLRVLATPMGNDQYALRIRGAHFGKQDQGKGIRRLGFTRPIYPQSVLQARVGGTVYLLIKLDDQGRVAEVAAEQTDLDAAGPDRSMDRWRSALERSSIAAARSWKFTVPAPAAGRPREMHLVRVPVRYALRRPGLGSQPRYGQWDIYIPGPRQIVPWLNDPTMLSDSADALPDDGVFPIGSGLHLTSPLSGA